jgi:UDPglucose 6-dehydrogenase
MRISVIGCGYVGLVAAACLAIQGNKVTIVDKDKDKIESVNRSIPPFFEEGLADILREADIEATTDYSRILDSAIIFICVGTPCQEGGISLENITEAAKQTASIMKHKKEYYAIVVKSTVTPGTTEQVIVPILETAGKKSGHDFGVCMSPEFLREGHAVHDFMNPSRVVIGEYDRRSGDTLAGLHRGPSVPVFRTDLRTAEMIKLASNAFLSTKISFINDIGNICKQLSIDTYEVAKGMGLDDRIGSNYLNAGLGFGGSCLPKDLRALIAKSRQTGYEPAILKEVLELNDKQALRLLELLKRHVPLKDAVIGLLGLTFKPGTDDVRESRAIKIAEALLQEGAIVKAYDPLGVEKFMTLFPQIQYVPKEDVMNCDAILILTEWEEFNYLDYRGKIVIDGRRVPRAKEARIYEGLCW